MALFSETRRVSLRTYIVFGSLMLLAAAFRLPQLPARPMHSDEAINADKLGVLLEHGEYKYSAADFHGPTLTYLTWSVARVQGIRNYADLNETTLRLVPALAGILLVGLHLFLTRYIGLLAAAASALLTAISPAMVYYSRYYIHEMLFVSFTFAALLTALRYWEARRAVWAAISGACIGLMFATKETAIIPVACMAVAAAGLAGMNLQKGWRPSGLAALPKHLALALAAAFAATALLISSFLTNPRGIADLVFGYRGYFLRGTGVGTPHVHPVGYYLRLMNFYRADTGPLFTEALITILAIIGLVAVIREWNKHHEASGFRLFLAIYSVAMVVVFSALPYKLPWNFLGPMHGMILLSGIGVSAWSESCRWSALRAGAAALVLIGLVHLGWQAWRSSFPLNSDPRNPWVYAHTSKDVFTIVQKMELLAAAYPARRADLPIAIVSRENLWPLPWYFRRFPRVQWWNGISDTASPAPVYLITPDMEMALTRRLYDLPPLGERELYRNLFDPPVELRPGVEIRGFASMSAWEGL